MFVCVCNVVSLIFAKRILILSPYFKVFSFVVIGIEAGVATTTIFSSTLNFEGTGSISFVYGRVLDTGIVEGAISG